MVVVVVVVVVADRARASTGAAKAPGRRAQAAPTAATRSRPGPVPTKPRLAEVEVEAAPRAGPARAGYVLWAVQLHPSGGRFDFARSSARTEGPHGGASYRVDELAKSRKHTHPKHFTVLLHGQGGAVGLVETEHASKSRRDYMRKRRIAERVRHHEAGR